MSALDFTSVRKAFVTSNPKLRIGLPESWTTRTSAFVEKTTPKCLVFASNESLSVPQVGEGDWDAPADGLSETGIAVEISAYDLRESPDTWLSGSAVAALKAAHQWPWDVRSKVAAHLSGGVALVELSVASWDGDQLTHRVGPFLYRNWVVAIDLWTGAAADLDVAEAVVSSIAPG